MVRVYYGPDMLEGQKEALDKVNRLKDLYNRLQNWLEEPASPEKDSSEDDDDWEEDWEEDYSTNEENWDYEDFDTWPEWSRELYSFCNTLSEDMCLSIDETLEYIDELDSELYEFVAAWKSKSCTQDNDEYTVGLVGGQKVICVQSDTDDNFPTLVYTSIITEELGLMEMKPINEEVVEDWEEEW